MQHEKPSVLFFNDQCPLAGQILQTLQNNQAAVVSVSTPKDLHAALNDASYDLFICFPREAYPLLRDQVREITNNYKSMLTCLIAPNSVDPEDIGDFRINEINLNDEHIVQDYFASVLRIASRQKIQTALSAMLLHDLRSPMQSILGYLELLEKDIFGEVNVGQRQILLNAIALSDIIIELLDELSQVYLFEQKKFEMIRITIHLRELLEETLRSLWIQADRKNIKFIPQLAPNLPDLVIDSHGIQRVLVNLLTNAIKFSPENGTVRIYVQQTETATHKPQIQFRISDSGPGIPSEHINHIFDKFFRLHDHKKVQKGQGLGLYISRLIVEAHGGQLGAYNNREGGSTFYFTLPVETKHE